MDFSFGYNDRVIDRTLKAHLAATVRSYPAVFLTGPRQSGKTTLARTTFPDFAYLSLEDLQNREEATDDPRRFLNRISRGPGAILDEVQNVPQLFSYLQSYLDERRGGPLVLTGSQHFLLSERIGQSLAGRVAILELLPLSVAEIAARKAITPDEFGVDREVNREAGGEDPLPQVSSLDEILYRGCYPSLYDRKLSPSTWLDGYVRTYVERDVRTLANVGDLDTFTRFLALAAGRSGQLLNLSSLAADAGVSQPTAKKWISVLRASYVIDLLQPHFENFSKRMIKTPKLHFLDTGLLCHLLRLRKPEDLETYPLRGAIFESFVVSELRKLFLHHGQRPPLYFWRDSNGREVDLLIDYGTRRVPIEIKTAETVTASALRGLDAYRALSGDPLGILVYGGGGSYRRSDTLVRGWQHVTTD